MDEIDLSRIAIVRSLNAKVNSWRLFIWLKLKLQNTRYFLYFVLDNVIYMKTYMFAGYMLYQGERPPTGEKSGPSTLL